MMATAPWPHVLLPRFLTDAERIQIAQNGTPLTIVNVFRWGQHHVYIFQLNGIMRALELPTTPEREAIFMRVAALLNQPNIDSVGPITFVGGPNGDWQ